MIYILPNNFINNEEFNAKFETEFYKAKQIHIIFNEVNKDKVNDLVNKYDVNNILIKRYKVDEDINEFRIIYNELSEEDKIYLKKVTSFNLEQYEANTLAKNNKLLINAGAGTGKTTTVVETVLNLLLDGDVQLNEILLTTFTNNSTDDMYKKIYNKLKERWKLTKNTRCLHLLENINDLKICTLHKYLNAVLADIGGIEGYSNNVSMISAKDKIRQYIYNLINERFEIEEFDLEDFGIYSKIINDIILAVVNNEKIDISKIESYRYRNIKNDNKIENLVSLVEYICSKITIDFIKELTSEDQVLMGNMNYKLNDLLSYNYDFSKKLTKYKYIFVDECQDTSKDQFEVLNKVIDIIDSKVFAVGDNMQSIYRFRNADPKSMEYFNEIINKNISLKNNYRTTKNIMEDINKTFEIIEGKKYQSLTPKKKEDKLQSESIKICRYTGEGKYSEILNVIKQELKNIEKLRTEHKNKKNDNDRIAILVRNNYEAKQIYNKLREQGIEDCVLEKGGSLFRTDAARDLLALVRCILYPNSIVHKVQMIQTPYCKFKVNINTNDFIAKYNIDIIDEMLSDIYGKVKQINNQTAFSILTDILYYIEYENKDYKDNLLLIIDELINNGAISTFSDIERFLELQLNHNEDTKSCEEKNSNSKIIISTFHSTKGLEFETVILVASEMEYIRPFSDRSKERYDILVNDNEMAIAYKHSKDNYIIKTNNYNSMFKTEKEQIRKDEINLLYVALTRCINKLFIVSPKIIKENTHSKLLEKGGLFKRNDEVR